MGPLKEQLLGHLERYLDPWCLWFDCPSPTAHAHSLYSLLPPTESQINQCAAEKESELKECLTRSWVMTNQAICLVVCLSAFDIVNSSGTYGGGGARSFAFILSLKKATSFYQPQQMLSCKSNGNIQTFLQECPNMSECNQQNARPAIFQMAIDWVSRRIATLIRRGNASKGFIVFQATFSSFSKCGVVTT